MLAIYGHSGHLGLVTKTIFTNCLFPLFKEAPHKFGFIRQVVLEEKMSENNGHTHNIALGQGQSDNTRSQFFFKMLFFCKRGHYRNAI